MYMQMKNCFNSSYPIKLETQSGGMIDLVKLSCMKWLE